MTTISSIPAPLVAYISGLGALTTILLCYALAVSFKHVPAWLPMISDCAVKAPEKYPFRAGIVLAAAALAVLVVLVYRAERTFTRSKVAVVFGLLGAISLTVIGVVNVEEWPPVHNGFAVASFLATEVYMILMSWFSRPDQRVSLAPKIIQQLCASYVAVAMVVAAILSGMAMTGTFAICVFQMALGHNLSGIVLSEVRVENNGVRALLKTHKKEVERHEKMSPVAPATQQVS